jgi:hypothetical protein
MKRVGLERHRSRQEVSMHADATTATTVFDGRGVSPAGSAAEGRCSVFDARAAYFAATGFSDAGYRDRWVVIKLGPVPVIVVPNTPARQRAIPLHDLHHVATGYSTTFRGEAEISAWEIAAGCGSYGAARFFGLAGFASGLVIAPRRTWRAFLRGRHSTTLYRTGGLADLRTTSVGELRAKLGLDGAGLAPTGSAAEWRCGVIDAPSPPATWRDRLAFAGYVAMVVAPVAAVGAAIGVAAIELIRRSLR